MVIASNSNLLGKITVLVMCCFVLNTALALLDGSGTQEVPWRIRSLEDFNDFSADPNYWDDYTRLETDVNLAGRVYERAVIAWDMNDYEGGFQGTAFTGVFDGNDHKIENLTSNSNRGGRGLFGCVDDPNTEIKNLEVTECYIHGFSFCGPIVAHLSNGKVSNCNVNNFQTEGNLISSGGLVGENRGIIENCSFEGPFSGYHTVGGLVGDNYGEITNCSVNGTITGYDSVGGLVGANWGGKITNCTVSGTVAGEDFIGGVVGANLYWVSIISNCRVFGTIEGINKVGGVAGEYYSGCMINCSVIGSVIGTGDVGGLSGRHNGYLSSCYVEGTVEGVELVGGLVGTHFQGNMGNCYMIGSVRGDNRTGGLVGQNGFFEIGFDSGRGKINRCYAAVEISDSNGNPPTGQTGGITGYNDLGKIETSFWDQEISGVTNMCGGEGIGASGCDDSYGKTTAEMQDLNTFVEAGWDFSRPVWMMHGENYPTLVWHDPDIDDNLKVDFADFALLSNQWLFEDCGWCGKADLTGDQKVNVYDLNLFVNKWLHEDHISDHVFDIEIENGLDYENPDNVNDTEYEFDFVLYTDSSVETVEFLTPTGNLFVISKDDDIEEEGPDGWKDIGRDYDSEEDAYNWFYEVGFYDPCDLLPYNDGQYGEYTIIIHYQDGRTHQTTIKFGIPQTTDPIPQPIQIPLFTSIHNEDELTSPITLEWEQWVQCESLVGSLTWIAIENKDNGEEYEFNCKCENSLPEDIILNEGIWQAWLTFCVGYHYINDDGIKIGIGKYSESDCEFTIVP